jgi:hypothetical protein
MERSQSSFGLDSRSATVDGNAAKRPPDPFDSARDINLLDNQFGLAPVTFL